MREAYCKPETTFNIEPYRDLSRSDGKLALHSVLPMSWSHGPGRRAVVWVQGCLKRCPGCINPAMLDAAKQENLEPVSDVARRLVEAKRSALNVEGITIQGGEPMLQAKNIL